MKECEDCVLGWEIMSYEGECEDCGCIASIGKKNDFDGGIYCKLPNKLCEMIFKMKGFKFPLI